jgi:hypothetical protein
MKNQQLTTSEQLQELDELYYTIPQDIYEAELHLAVTQLAYILPGFTIAYAEIWSEGSERIQHGGIRHVLTPIEYIASAEGNEE